MSKISEYEIPFPHPRSFPDPAYKELQEIRWQGKQLLYIQVAHVGQYTHAVAIGFRIEEKSDYERPGSKILIEEIDPLLEEEIRAFLRPRIFAKEVRIYR